MNEHARLIETLCDGPANVQQVIEGLPTSGLTWSDGGWSIAGVLTHLAIHDVYFSQRLRHITLEDDPILSLYRFDDMIPVTGNPNTPPAEMFDRWQANRSQLCAWIEGLSAADWSRPATHPERGRTTFGKEVQMLIDHDTEHLAQIDGARRGWEARRTRSLVAVRSR